MALNLDAIWADFYFELEAGFADMRREMNWDARFKATDEGAEISSAAFDECFVTRPRRTEVVCTMRWAAQAESAAERTVRFRLDVDGVFPLLRLDGEAEVPETTASAAHYLLETFRTGPRPDPAG
jgi:hypothetical protein